MVTILGVYRKVHQTNLFITTHIIFILPDGLKFVLTYLSYKVNPALLLIIQQYFFILIHFQINGLLPFLLIQKEFTPSFESRGRLCQIMEMNMLERITNCPQNNRTSNMTHLVLITQNLMEKSDKSFRP